MNYDNIFRQEVEDKVNNLAENQDLQNRERAIYRLKLGKSPG